MKITTIWNTIIDWKVVKAFSILTNEIKIYWYDKTYTIPYSKAQNIKVNWIIKVKDWKFISSYHEKWIRYDN